MNNLIFIGTCKFYVKVLDIPLTVKMRTGISDKKTSWNAHKLISNLKLWDVSLVTVSQSEVQCTCMLCSRTKNFPIALEDIVLKSEHCIGGGILHL